MYLDLLDGYHTVVTTANKEEVSLDVEIINFYDDVIYYDVDTLGDTIPDQRMLIVKYHKSLTVQYNAVLRPKVRKRGMLVLCLGAITNYGYISMTARGAIAPGQNIYLYTTSTGSIEFVPAVGGPGGQPITVYDYNTISGQMPVTPGFRKLGGGGSGGAGGWRNSNSNQYCRSGAGGAATSYSGGAGGGGIRVDVSWNGNYTPAIAGSSTGGAGGAGYAIQGNNGTLTAGGGAGNSGGQGKQSDSGGVQYNNNSYNGMAGTGGLLIIFSQVLINKGYIEAKGSNGGGGTSGGGGSGGGGINIFCKTLYNDYDSSISVAGGIGGGSTPGGNGATGSIHTMSNLNLIAMFMIQQGDNIYTLKESQYITFPTKLEDMHVFKSASDGVSLSYDMIMNNATSNINTLIKAITVFKNANINNIKILKYKN